MTELKVKYIGTIREMDGVSIPQYKTKLIDKSFVRHYYSTLYVLSGLNACSKDLMNYLTTVMDSENIVRNDSYLRGSFSKYIKESTLKLDGHSIVYSDSNIRNAFALLSSRNCLVKLSKGVYKVNPEFFFKKTDNDRLKAVKVYLEFKEGIRNSEMKIEYILKEDKLDEE